MRILTAILACLFGCSVVVVPFVHDHETHEAEQSCAHGHDHDEGGSDDHDAAPVDACAICAVAALNASLPLAAPSVQLVAAFGEGLCAPAFLVTCRIHDGSVLARGPPQLV